MNVALNRQSSDESNVTRIEARGAHGRTAMVADLDPERVRARLDLFLEAACEGIYDWNLAADDIWVSARLLEIFDIGERALTPSLWLQLIHADDLQRYRDAIREHLRSTDSKLDVEYRIRTQHGGYRWVLDRSMAIRREDGRVVHLVGAVLDITEQKRREAELAHNAWLLENTLQHMSQGITMVDADLNLVAYNDRCRELLDLPAALLAERPPMAKVFRYQAERGEYGEGAVEDWVARRVADYGKFSPRTYERVRPDGTVIEVCGMPLPDGRGYVTTFTDITRRKQAERRLLALATTDGLTGLYNRRRFFELSGKELTRALRRRLDFSVLYIDIDRFNAVNDRYGHAVGDAVLRHVAGMISEVVRQEDIVGRLGGEEFAVLLPDTGRDGAVGVAERLRQAIAECELSIGEAVVRPTVSIGLTAGEPGRDTLEDAIQRADEALYRAKHNGRNRVESA